MIYNTAYTYGMGGISFGLGFRLKLVLYATNFTTCGADACVAYT